jgi:hypothetical protein
MRYAMSQPIDRRRIAALASQYDIPQSDEALTIERAERHVMIKGTYDKNIEIVPSYKYPWQFKWELDVMMPAVLPYFPPK